jgi:hypothetical protein
MGSSIDASGSYGTASVLPGGGNASVDLVAPKNGRYYLAVTNGVGAYSITLEAYRGGTETDKAGTVQTIFLDFNGGLKPSDENKVINAVVATVKENLAKDLAAKGNNPNFAVRILNSRDNADPFGQLNVSRVVVGGTIAETDIPTIGIAQSIDPGNFSQEETAIIMLDLVSAPAPNPNSINSYLAPTSDKIGFIGRGLGNIIVHEAGHFSGNWHTDQHNDVASLMDQGGNIAQMFGVGPDGVGGTADDVDVDFVTDAYTTDAPFTGVEDTMSKTAWAYSRGIG